MANYPAQATEHEEDVRLENPAAAPADPVAAAVHALNGLGAHVARLEADLDASRERHARLVRLVRDAQDYAAGRQEEVRQARDVAAIWEKQARANAAALDEMNARIKKGLEGFA